MRYPGHRHMVRAPPVSLGSGAKADLLSDSDSRPVAGIEIEAFPTDIFKGPD